MALSAFGSREEEISALNAGTDGYLSIEGTLDQELLLAHASALMRRYLSASTREYAAIQIGGIGLKINLNLRKAFLNGENLHLTPLQFSILASLAEHLGEVVTKEELYQAAWPNDYARHTGESVLWKNYTQRAGHYPWLGPGRRHGPGRTMRGEAHRPAGRRRENYAPAAPQRRK